MYQTRASGAEHFGALKIIQMAPANITTHNNQKVMKKIQRNRIQNGSLTYFINSSLVIPVKFYKKDSKRKEKQKISKFQLNLNVLASVTLTVIFYRAENAVQR